MARSLFAACPSPMFWKGFAAALVFPVVIVTYNTISQGVYRATVPIKNVESSPVDPEAVKQIWEIRDSTFIKINTTTQECSQIQATHCYVFMSAPLDLPEGKDCNETSTTRGQETSCVTLLKKRSKRHTCCDVAEWCNDEKYCGHGKMMCLSKRRLEHPKCVCHKGWQGPRCEQCSQIYKVPCRCYDGYPYKMACSSNDADPEVPCWTHHRINGQNYPFFCQKAKDGQTFIPDTRCSWDRTDLCDTRCSWDRTDLCVAGVGSDNKSAEDEKAGKIQSQTNSSNAN